MITYLKVRNLAIVEELAIEPGAGLNVLTGETGAGKSLLIDSLELLRGARSSTDSIRAGAEKMTAEAVFEIPPAAAEAIASLGVEIDGGELIVKREVAANGRGRELAEAAGGAFSLVEDDESSALAQLGRAAHLMQPLSREVAELGAIASELQDAIYRLQETARSLSRLAESVRHDPARLEEIEDRLATIDRLNKKYGGSVEAVLGHLGAIQDEPDRLSDYDANVEKLQRIEQQRAAAYRDAAEKLSASRAKAAKAFEKAIQDELNDLAMERTTVRIVISAAAAPSAAGFDDVEILIAPNRGEEPKPMQRIASGGELSRIQLAIAAALFKTSPAAAAATLVFDEVDAGIGGRVAEVVGRKLQQLAAKNQVICVTHLPQIASFAATHFYVWKEDAGGHTCARIRRLDDDEQRVAEIARMLGGESVPASAVLHARELLDGARGRAARARR